MISAVQEDVVRASEGLFALAFVTVGPGLVLVVASPFMLIGLYRPPRLRAVYAFVISLLGGALLLMASVPLLLINALLLAPIAAVIVFVLCVWLAFHRRRPHRVGIPDTARVAEDPR